MAIRIRRREFIVTLGTAATAPLVAHGQPPTALPVIGSLHSATADSYAPEMAAFRRGLSGGGYAEGKNVALEYRWGDNQVDRLPALAADLVRHQVTVIFAGGSYRTGLA